MPVMSKDEFRRRWKKDLYGDGITYEDIADCAIAWGIDPKPKTKPMQSIVEQVLIAADMPEEV